MNRHDESKHIACARRVITKHAPEVYARGIVEQDPMVDALIAKCDRKAVRYERRELRILVMKKYKMLGSVKSSTKFKRAIIAVAECKLIESVFRHDN